VNSTTVAAEQT